MMPSKIQKIIQNPDGILAVTENTIIKKIEAKPEKHPLALVEEENRKQVIEHLQSIMNVIDNDVFLGRRTIKNKTQKDCVRHLATLLVGEEVAFWEYT